MQHYSMPDGLRDEQKTLVLKYVGKGYTPIYVVLPTTGGCQVCKVASDGVRGGMLTIVTTDDKKQRIPWTKVFICAECAGKSARTARDILEQLDAAYKNPDKEGQHIIFGK